VGVEPSAGVERVGAAVPEQVVAGDEGPGRVRLDVGSLDQEPQRLAGPEQGARGPELNADIEDLSLGGTDLALVRMDRLAGNPRTPGIWPGVQFPVRDPLPPVRGLAVILQCEVGEVDE
jgi:hypothetical protein